MEKMYFVYTPEQLQALHQKDAAMATLIDKVGTIQREVLPDFFTAAVFTIIGQQISAKAQENIWQRLAELLAQQSSLQHLTAKAIGPEVLLACSSEQLRSCGLSPAKVKSIQALSTAIVQGKLNPSQLSTLSDDAIIDQLTVLPGIGLWTAQMLLIFCFQRMNVLCYNDFGIREGICILYNLKGITRAQFKEFQERFSPYGTLASFYLWELANGHVQLP